MRLTQEGLALLKELEGLRLKAYRCQAGAWTIGYGHTLGVKEGMVIDEKLANKWLLSDIANVELTFRAPLSKLNNNQISALVILVFNVGIYGFKKSKLFKLLNNGGTIEDVQKEWLDWCHYRDHDSGLRKESPGLLSRRKKEFALFIKPMEN